MKISQIIEGKDIKDTFTASPNDLVGDVANKLANLGVGALLVSEDGVQLDGIITERDIIRGLGKSGVSCLKQKASELMTSKVVTIQSDTDTKEAMQMMSDGRFRHLPVYGGDKLLGVLSIRDVITARLKEMENENNALNDMISGAVF